MGASGASAGNDASIARRLAAATDELQVLEKLVISGDCSPRVLSEFRAAVDSIRRTTWAVQQWSELQEQHRDPYSVLDVLAQVRVQRATQLSRELTMDLQSLELSLETEGLAELFRTTRGLYACLAPLFKKSEVGRELVWCVENIDRYISLRSTFSFAVLVEKSKA